VNVTKQVVESTVPSPEVKTQSVVASGVRQAVQKPSCEAGKTIPASAPAHHEHSVAAKALNVSPVGDTHTGKTDISVQQAAEPEQIEIGPQASVLREPQTAVRIFMQSYQQMPPEYDVAKKAEAPAQTVQSFLPEQPKLLRMIGSAFNSYILVEYNDHLLLIDQQGVHERLLFDRMLKALDTQNCSQELLIPIIVPATRREQQLLETHQALLREIGLTVETFGETEVAIRAIPMILGQPQAGDLLREIIDQLEGERGIVSLEKRRAGVLAIACKKAVRRGEKLTESDLRELVVRMVEKNITPTSPRGTPLIVALSHSDVDRRFRRPQ
jgi:DNA mismatch repair ATPase MutL